MVDVIIIGGGAAGLSAGLILGRFRRAVMICDTGTPRNARSTGVHGFLSRDGILPQELMQISRDQLTPHSTVQFCSQAVMDIVPTASHYIVHFQDGTSAPTKKILFATGVKDILPAIDGLEELWGQAVFHCPYCHGWEVRDKSLAIIVNGANAIHFAKLLRALSNDIVICTNGVSEMDAADRRQLDHLGISVIETPILRLQRQNKKLDGLVFADGSFLAREAVFIRPPQQQHSTLPAKLGCTMTEQGYVAVNEMGKTSLDGVFAAGDMTSPAQQVIHAASRGAMAAAAINAELAHESFMLG